MANRNRNAVKDDKEYDSKKVKKKTKSKSKDKEYSKGKVNSEVSNETDKGWNDARWYIPVDQLRNDVGSFPLNDTIGIPTHFRVTADGTESISDWTVNSVMSVIFHSAAGIDPADANGVRVPMNNPVNVCARKLYAAISAENSKTTQYQPADLALAILAVGELISLINLATRAYGLAWNYNPRNRQVPRSLIKASGIDPDSLLDNLTPFRMRLNRILTKASNIRMLADFKYFEKCGAIYGSVYMDQPAGMRNYIVPTTYTYWMLDESSTPSKLKDKYINGTSYDIYTASQLLDAIDDVVDSLLLSSTMNYVYTDIVNYIMKRGGQLVGFNYIPEMMVITPVYDPLFKNQLHNAFVLPDHGLQNVTQNPADNNISWSLSLLTAFPMLSINQLIDFFDTDSPDVNYKIDSVMFKSMVANVTSDGQGGYYSNSIITPDHYITGYYAILDSTENMQPLYMNIYTPDNTVTTQVSVWSKFDQFPIVYTSSDGGTSFSDVWGDLNCYTMIDWDQFRNILEYSYLGLFDVESAGGSIFNQVLARK